MKVKWENFGSFLSKEINEFLSYKRGLRKSFLTEEYALRLFDRFLQAQTVNSLSEISISVMEAFLASRCRNTSRSHNHLLGVLRRLFTWMLIQEMISEMPPLPQRRPMSAQRIPFIFTKEQVQQLLEAAIKLPDSRRTKNRGATYRLMFALLYALGLRVGEVVRLQRGDVDLERRVLFIRESKFSKSRLVPFGPNIARSLESYIRMTAHEGDVPVFSVAVDKRPVGRSALKRTFRILIGRIDLKRKPGTGYPRPHDLRHSMAVGTLLRWYREGRNPADWLIQLSTLLGHSSVASTSVYLTITDDLLTQAGHRFEQFAIPLIGGERNDDA